MTDTKFSYQSKIPSDKTNKPMRCDVCEERITVCEMCAKEFEIKQEILCFGGHHFCGHDCLKNYGHSEPDEATVEVEDDE